MFYSFAADASLRAGSNVEQMEVKIERTGKLSSFA